MNNLFLAIIPYNNQILHRGDRYQEGIIADESRVSYIRSFKGKYQLCLDDFPFTRHSNIKDIIYWRCVQFKSLGCRARLRTNLRNNEQFQAGDNDERQKVEIVCNNHNHEHIKHRRKKGDLKKLHHIKIEHH
ncbi:hypothetical protein ACKWTF_011507 [Chironomus riparius]